MSSAASAGPSAEGNRSSTSRDGEQAKETLGLTNETNPGEHILIEPQPRTISAAVRENDNSIELDAKMTWYSHERLPKLREVVFQKEEQKGFFNETQAKLLNIQWVATNGEDGSEGYWGTVTPSSTRIYASYFGRYESTDGVHLQGNNDPLDIMVIEEGITSYRPRASLSGELIYLFHMPSSIHERLSKTENIVVVTGQSLVEGRKREVVELLSKRPKADLLKNDNHSFRFLGVHWAKATYDWQDLSGEGVNPVDQPDPYGPVSDDENAQLVHSRDVDGDIGFVSTNLAVTPGGNLAPDVVDRDFPSGTMP